MVLQLGPVNQAGGQMDQGSWQPQGLSETIRKGRLPSRVLRHTCSVLGQEGPDAIKFACGLRTNRNHNRVSLGLRLQECYVAQPLAFS